MCGIAGIIDFAGTADHASQLERMIESLNHRGPDEQGTYITHEAFLAHKRLVVIDQENGKQPMTRCAGEKKYTICYNGELYNTKEIANELRAYGYAITSHSDTEVLLYSYICFGEACLERLNGIFAFAIYEEPENKLFLARDRIGVKPLFYAQRGSCMLFASEIKALLASGMIPAEVDRYGLAEVFLIGPGRTEGNGVFRHIDEIKPGCCLTCTAHMLRQRRYWALCARPHEHTEAQTVETVRELVYDSISRQLISDVPVCTFLSGGLDSSIITAIAAAQKSSLHSFSVNYTDNDKYFKASYFQPNSDDTFIGIMSRFCCSTHHVVTLGIPELTNALLPATEARDLPGMADVDSSLLLFCAEIKKHATVALSGECADEIFGGYPWYHDKNIYSREEFPWSRSTQARAEMLKKGILGNIDPHQYVMERYLQTISDTPKLPGDSPLDARMREMFMLNIHWFMQTLLDRKDRMSMANALEVRVPFCDHRIVEYAFNIPWAMKAKNGREKGILRTAVKGLLPQEIVERKKSPYPKTHHPLYLQLVRCELAGIMRDKSSPLLEIIHPQTIEELLEGKEIFTLPMYGQLMTQPQVFAYLIQVNYWLKQKNINIL